MEVKRTEAAVGLDDHLQQAADLGLDGVLDGAQRFFWHVRRRIQILGLWRTQLADLLVDLDEFGAEPLEVAKGGHLAFGLVNLGGRGEGLLDGLAVALVGQAHLGAVAGMVVAGAGAVGLAAAAEGRMDRAASEVAELGDFEQDL